MASDLKETTVSRDHLSAEVVERKKAQEQLVGMFKAAVKVANRLVVMQN